MRIVTIIVVVALGTLSLVAAAGAPDFLPGRRVLLDAHNCYPYDGKWADRIDRALQTGTPLAMEPDLAWYTDTSTGKSWSIVTHGEPYTGKEPTLETYFFERIRQTVETALARDDRSQWPLITLNMDFKSNEPEHLQAIWNVLGKYESWLTTAERVADPAKVMPLDVKPVLVLTGTSDEQQRVFFDKVPVGGRLMLFGAAQPLRLERGVSPATISPDKLMTFRATNYRRWWNNPWVVVEDGGQRQAGEWTTQENARLRALVSRAHELGLWIRFYTLNGHADVDGQGWSEGYNFGSLEAARLRWRAAAAAGVDFIATDQYEAFAADRGSVLDRR
jgi:hypothetical protein